MNKIRKILRIIFCPLIFVLWVAAMTLFFGPICLMLGVGKFIGYIFKSPGEYDDLKEDLIFTFIWITGPIYGTIQFLKTGEICSD